MNRFIIASTVVLTLLVEFAPVCLEATVRYDSQIPQLVFAAGELESALRESATSDLEISIVIDPEAFGTQAFRIRRSGANRIAIIASDPNGGMYGGLEVAERIRLGLPIEEGEQKPFIEKRGVKINIPLDIRTPAFDDSGGSAQRNIETMWDFEFWREYLDDLARYRYNLVSLWAAHPFPNMIKLEEYPDIAMDDVYYSKEGSLSTTHLDAAVRLEDATEGTLGLGKRITIDEKIRYWQRVFEYAEDRGIEIMMVHWNVHLHGADGKYGITNEQENPITMEYIRACVKEMLLTYPQITGIGVCAGENDDRYLRDEYKTENFVFNSYGKAVMDVRELQPEREVRFIIRRHSTEYEDITEAFKTYSGTMEASVKYAVAHMYSSRRPQEWEKRIVEEGWLEKYKVWLNLRNDDIFMHRWGSPDYARDFIKWMPHEHMAGFYMGSDTYVWGREFISRNPETSGWLEIRKHWYQFRLWGQLAYNNELDDEYWAAALKHRFPGIDAMLLLKAWESVSEVVPQLNRAVWSPTDGSFAAEGCRRTSGFLTLDGYYFERPAMILNRIENAPDPQCLTVTEWARAYLTGEEMKGLSPLQIADNLDSYAEVAQTALPALREQMGDNVELRETLNDIDSMSYLGRYFADKMRGAAKLALYREGGRRIDAYLDQSVAHLEDAVEEWKAYAAILTPQYKTQIGARANSMDWNGTLKDVEQEVQTIREEGDFPQVEFVNLVDGARIQAGSDLRVEIKATDGNGPPTVKLRLNGQVLTAEKTGDKHVWSASSDEFLESLDAGCYSLEAMAVDRNGLRTSREINILVGNASWDAKGQWKDEIHQVILNDGEKLRAGEIRYFPRLECYLILEDEGSLSLISGTPDNSGDRIWGTNGKADRPKPHAVPFRFYLTVNNGQFKIVREKAGRPDVIIYQSRPMQGKGPFKLGITASRELVVIQE